MWAQVEILQRENVATWYYVSEVPESQEQTVHRCVNDDETGNCFRGLAVSFFVLKFYMIYPGEVRKTRKSLSEEFTLIFITRHNTSLQ